MMLSKITEIREIREMKAGLSAREAELCKPRLTDISRVGEIYRWFTELSDAPNRKTGMETKKFIFICLYLYCPSALAGGQMVDGLRSEICKAAGISQRQTVTRNVSQSVFAYRIYKYFRNDVNRIYNEIINRLDKEESVK